MLGAVVAALVLTKVNAGVFAAVAILFAGLTLAPALRPMRLLRGAAALLFVGTPFLLIVVAGGHGPAAWATKYAFVVALAAVSVVVTTRDPGLRGLVKRADAYRFLIGGAGLGVFVLLVALLSGTRPADLVRGAFIGPSGQADTFSLHLHVPITMELWGVACLAVAVVYHRYRRRNPPAGLLDAGAHVFAGMLILYFALAKTQIHGSPPFPAGFAMALPLLFFAAVPPAGSTDSERIARVGVVSLAVLEGLLAYPVAGTEIFMAAVLAVPVGLLCLHDGVRQLRPALAGEPDRALRTLVTVVVSFALVAGLSWLAWVFTGDLSAERNGYNAGVPVALPGTGRIRLPAAQARELAALAAAIRARCSSLVTLPGANSFYFWTGEDPPTSFNTTSWMYLLDAAQQQQIVHQVERQDRSRFCVVDNPSTLAFWESGAGGRRLPARPLLQLVRQVEQEDRPAAAFGGYRLYVPHRAAP